MLFTCTYHLNGEVYDRFGFVDPLFINDFHGVINCFINKRGSTTLKVPLSLRISTDPYDSLRKPPTDRRGRFTKTNGYNSVKVSPTKLEKPLKLLLMEKVNNLTSARYSAPKLLKTHIKSNLKSPTPLKSSRDFKLPIQTKNHSQSPSKDLLKVGRFELDTPRKIKEAENGLPLTEDICPTVTFKIERRETLKEFKESMKRSHCLSENTSLKSSFIESAGGENRDKQRQLQTLSRL